MRPGRAPLALWFLLLAGFVALSGFASAYDRFPADLWLAHRLQDVDAAAFVRSLDWAEDLADVPWIAIIWAGGVAALAVTAHRWQALLLFASMLARPLNGAVKELVGRPRPSDDLVAVSDRPASHAFPSGHADAALVLYGLLFYFITMFVPQRRLRLLGQAACLWVILLTGMERVQVGAHWPSDVIGGYYLGGLVLAVLIATNRLLATRQRGE
ncbi:MAG: phosphatase PAP2 family protein [Dehalococcoidia bacterium]